MSVATGSSTRAQHHRTVKRELTESPHPEWVAAMIGDLKSEWNGVSESRLFRSTVDGPFPEEAWKRVILEYFGIVEAFPKYMGVYLGRTTFGQTEGDVLARDWLIGNIRVEALHAQWYIEWGMALGLDLDEIVHHRPGPEVAALQEYLWSVAYRGSLAEAFAAINYAIEGTTGDWTRVVMPQFIERFGDDKNALRWLAEHAEYDDAHPREALELIKITAQDEKTRSNVVEAARLSLQLFRRGFDACYDFTAASSAV
jgi:pyrroloquinoline quinone (PQQ) biosynthesis protein C